MRILVGLIMGAALVATSAAAQPGRLSDGQFLEAARCAGLASSHNLDAGDGASLKTLLKDQSVGRDPYILERADEQQSQGRREADRAGEFTKAKLSAELSGACASLKN